MDRVETKLPISNRCWKSLYKKEKSLYSYRTYRLKQNCFTGTISIAVRRYTVVNRIFYFTEKTERGKKTIKRVLFVLFHKLHSKIWSDGTI